MTNTISASDNSMNHTDRIYVRFRGRTLGPFTTEKAKQLIQQGKITRMHELSADGMNWYKAETFSNLFTASHSAVEAKQTAASRDTSVAEPRNNEPAANHPQAPASRVEPNAPAEPSVEWYANINSENVGPVAATQIRQWVEAGQMNSQTLVWRSGFDNWQAVGVAMPELFAHRAAVNMAVQQTAVAGAPAGQGDLQHGSAERESLNLELNRNRGWASFVGIMVIITASLQIIGQLIFFVVSAGESAGAPAAATMAISTIVGVAWSVTLLTAGVLLLRYCDALSKLSRVSSSSYTLLAARRLSSLWSYLGIVCLVWLVAAGLLVFVIFCFILAAA